MNCISKIKIAIKKVAKNKPKKFLSKYISIFLTTLTFPLAKQILAHERQRQQIGSRFEHKNLIIAV